MSSAKRERLWEAAKKEMKYFETQTELLVASMSNLASSRQTQTLAMVSTKYIPTLKIEHEIFTQMNNSEGIINRMESTLKSIERELVAFKIACEKDQLIVEAIHRNVDLVLFNCKSHISSCRESFKSLTNDPLLSEMNAKALLALIIHRPLLFENHRSHIPDIESLLSIK